MNVRGAGRRSLPRLRVTPRLLGRGGRGLCRNEAGPPEVAPVQDRERERELDKVSLGVSAGMCKAVSGSSAFLASDSLTAQVNCGRDCAHSRYVRVTN